MAANDDIALSVTNLHKDFRLPHERVDSIKERVLHFRTRNKSYEKFHALRDIGFEVKRGEFFGIVGRNGSGKSTLLKIIGGIYPPTKGDVRINGTLTPFIELGIGFSPELTGRDNVFLNGAILGLTHKEIVNKYQEIVDFSELHKFMDQKLKNYSSGMQVRLAFSIAIQAHNDILLIDEVLAVGDASFQRKCFETFKSIKQHADKTVIFVSHDMSAIREYCDRAILIEGGNIVSHGEPDKVANNYMQLFNRVAKSANNTENRWGDFVATISDIDVKVGKDQVNVSCVLAAKADIQNPIIGIIIKDLDGHHLIESNNKWKKINAGSVAAGAKIAVNWDIPNVFRDGKYYITLAAAHEGGFEYYDWQEEVISFEVNNPEPTAGLIILKDKISIRKL